MKRGFNLVAPKLATFLVLGSLLSCPSTWCADVSVSVRVGPLPAFVGRNLIYTFAIANRGSQPATNVSLYSYFPVTLLPKSLLATNGVLFSTNGFASWNLSSMAGQSTSTVSMIVAPNVAGALTNHVVIAADGADPNPGDNEQWLLTPVSNSGVDLVISATDTPDPVSVGSPVTYKVQLSNHGNFGTYSVILTSTLPASATSLVVQMSGGSHTINGSEIVCSWPELSPGWSTSLQITATPTSLGNFTNILSAASSEVDTLPANNTDIRVVTAVQPPASLLSFSMSAFPHPVVAGGMLTLRFSVTNSGTGPSGMLTISNLLPPSLILNWEATTNPVVTLTNGVILCSLPPLAPHSSVSVDVVTTPVSLLTITNRGRLLEAGSVLPSGMLGSGPITVVPALPTQPMQRARSGHSATLLMDGRVLLAGGAGTNLLAEIYNPKTDVMSGATNMIIARSGHTASLLSDGRVLITGGTTATGAVASTEMYDPSNNAFTAGASLPSPRNGHMALTLTNGTVLIVGGTALPATEVVLFNPQTQSFEEGGHLAVPRGGVAAAVLGDGRVLIVGGDANSAASAELYEPGSKSSALVGSFLFYHPSLSVTALPDGSAVVIGGTNAEVFLRASGTFTNGGSMLVEHRFPEVCLLPNGQVMVSGGLGRTYDYFIETPSVEIFNPATVQFVAAHPMTESRRGHRAVVLPDGRVFISGGWSGHTLNSTEIYTLILDVDNDGMDDNWELTHNLGPGDRNDAIGDLDHDGHSNLQEYLTGTDPLDPSSIMRIATVELAAGTVRIDFTTAPGKRYAVEWGASVEAGNWTILADNISGTGGLKRVEDHPPAGSTGRVYRVRLIP